jgi:predicted RND superfamily exporter protein
VSSLLDVIKDMNQVMHSDDPAYYQIPDEQELVAQLLLLYEMADGTEQEHWVDYEYTTLRLMVEISEFDTAEIEREFHYIERRVKDLFPEAKFGMVGGAVQVSVAQHYISKGEIVSFLIALVVVGILMILVFQSVKTGLIGMIPNLAPALVVGGIMGYLDIPLEMTTMMIIPMLLGLAVDDTIHFITHCKLEFQRTGNYQKSIETTFKTVGKAIFMTSFILIAAFSVYMSSIAKFFVNLSVLAISGVLSALLADYFITPILVNWSKPFGSAKKVDVAKNQPTPKPPRRKRKKPARFYH